MGPINVECDFFNWSSFIIGPIDIDGDFLCEFLKLH